IQRVKLSLDLMREFMQDFGVQLPPSPTVPGICATLAQQLGQGAPSLHAITAGLHRTDAILKLYQETTDVIIEQFKSYPADKDEGKAAPAGGEVKGGDAKKGAAAQQQPQQPGNAEHRSRMLGVSQEQLLALLEQRADREDDSAAKDFLKAIKPK